MERHTTAVIGTESAKRRRREEIANPEGSHLAPSDRLQIARHQTRRDISSLLHSM